MRAAHYYHHVSSTSQPHLTHTVPCTCSQLLCCTVGPLTACVVLLDCAV